MDDEKPKQLVDDEQGEMLNSFGDGPPGLGFWRMRRLDPNEPIIPAHVLPTWQLISFEIVADDKIQVRPKAG